MRNSNFNEKIKHLASLIILLSMFCGCKKTGIQYENHSDEKFFMVDESQPDIIKQIAGRIKRQNFERPFIANLSRQEGNIQWNKSQIIKLEGETLVYIPLVLDNTAYVNGYLFYRQNGKYKNMELIRGRDYIRYGFAEGSRSHAIIGNLIRLNNHVFGTTRFLLMDNRLFGLDKISKNNTPLTIEFKPTAIMVGAEHKTTTPNTVSNSTTPIDEDMPALDEAPLKECARIVLVSNCGVHMDSGNYDCNNLYVTFLSTPCTEPPSTPPVSPEGYDAGGSDTDGSSTNLPGLNITMPPCPSGMSQWECDALTIPVMSYLLTNSDFASLNSPIDVAEETVIENGITVEDVADLPSPGTGSRPIAHTKPRGNVEDMSFGIWADVTGIIPSQLPLSDAELFRDMRRLFSACTIFDNSLGQVAAEVISKFESRNQVHFENPVLNQKVSQNVSLVNFAKKFGDDLRTRLQAAGGNINLVNHFEIAAYRPIFNGMYNKFHGLQILVNDTEFTEIELDNFTMDAAGNWEATVTIKIHDHFGLDKNDALSFQRYHSGFASWWLLQHTRGYPPFQTVMTVKKKIMGNCRLQ